MSKKTDVIELDDVVIRFSGDSGDGMQMTGTQFSDTSAIEGNDISTFPDYPAEIRAPQGTVGGVSGFQLHFGHNEVNTPGDYADVLVAMNPAAIKANVQWLKPHATIIYDSDSFTPRNIKKAGYEDNPIKEEKLYDYNRVPAPISKLTREALKDMELDNKSILRSKNMFALGMAYWLFQRPLEHTEHFFEEKFKKAPKIVQANKKVLKAGYHYAEHIQTLPIYKVPPANIEKGNYRSMNGNTGIAWGFLAAAEKSGLNLFCGSYPITPATEILQEIAKRKSLGAISFQAEDEIAGICTTIGASFSGSLGVTTTSGPGLALKSEALGLAIMVELPLVVVDVQRGGPSTGLPTKTEQSDLMQALYGRNGESPAVVMAASRPTNCFIYAYKAAKIAIEHMTPVILLSDGYMANGSEPWRIPEMKDLEDITPPLSGPCERDESDPFLPYKREAKKLIRKWAPAGTPGCEHRVGGLEKMKDTGNVSYIPENHEEMVKARAEKIKRIQKFIPDLKVHGDESGELLVIGWGGTFGHLYTAVKEMREKGKKISMVHFDYINPLPKNVAEVFGSFDKLLVCELNNGQMANYLHMNYPDFKYQKYNKIQGLPFTVSELKEKFKELL